MALRRASGMLRPYLGASRRLATTAGHEPMQAMGHQPRRGPVLPPHNDPAAYHPREESVHLTSRWLKISVVSTTALTLFFLTMGDHHKHSEETPEYEFLKRASRSPRFPWGDEDLFGTPEDRGEGNHEEGHEEDE